MKFQINFYSSFVLFLNLLVYSGIWSILVFQVHKTPKRSMMSETLLKYNHVYVLILLLLLLLSMKILNLGKIKKPRMTKSVLPVELDCCFSSQYTHTKNKKEKKKQINKKTELCELEIILIIYTFYFHNYCILFKHINTKFKDIKIEVKFH